MKVRLLVLAAVLAAATAAFLLLRARDRGDGGAVRVSGNIEATEVEVSFRLAGRVAERPVSEGQAVRAGQVAARLETTDLASEVAQQRAQVRATEAALAELTAGSRPEEVARAAAAERRAQAALDQALAGSRPEEVASAEAALARDRAEADRLAADAARQEELYRAGLISLREREASATAYRVAAERAREAGERRKLVREGPRSEEIRQARAARDEAREQALLVRNGPRREAIDQTRARLAAAREALAQAENRLGYATALVPLDGVVLAEAVEPGEYVAPGTPVVTVADLSRVWLRAYVEETDLGRVRLGQRVRVSTDTYPGRAYQGVVTFLASEAEFTPKAVQTRRERVKLVYRVKVELANPRFELKPGMPADGEIVGSEG